MDPQEYRDARWYSLLREAEDLGVPAEQAPSVVAEVLAQQRRRIRRAEDPDPDVRAALADAVLGRPVRPRRTGWLVALGLVTALGVAGVAIAVTHPQAPPPHHLRANQIPSLFGYDGPAAARLLADRGLQVQLQPFRSCEVLDRVTATYPPVGTPYHRGEKVVVYTSIPASISCLTRYQDRELAWRLLDFANGRGPAPRFAARVFVYPEDGSRFVLSGTEADDPDAWAPTGVLDAIRTASGQVALVSDHPLIYNVPGVRIAAASEGLGTCGVPDTSVAGTADVVAVLVVSADRGACPLRVELYRDDAGRIESVALYRSRS